MDKLTGSARRKRPRFMNERVANENAAILKQSVSVIEKAGSTLQLLFLCCFQTNDLVYHRNNCV